VSDDPSVLDFPSRPGGIDGELVHAVEAILFASGKPISASRMADLLEVSRSEVIAAVRVLGQRRAPAGVVVERIAGGWQLRTAPRFASLIVALRGAQPKRLSKAALEVLAAVAYEQPCTRGDVEALRGVDSGGVMKSLLERGLLQVAGRANQPGRPLVYKTSRDFLELFGLPDLGALPTLAEREELERGGDGEGDPVPALLDDADQGKGATLVEE
jgi:segregation and condensation protein B